MNKLATTYLLEPQIRSAPSTQHRRIELPPITQSSPIRNSSKIHSAPTTQHRHIELPLIAQSSPIRNSSKWKASPQCDNKTPKKQKILAAPFPISNYDSDEEIEIIEGFYDCTTTSKNDKGKGKAVGEEVADEEEANIAGPSSAPSRCYAFDRAAFIAACAEVEDVIREDGQFFNDDEKESVRELHKTIDGFFD